MKHSTIYVGNTAIIQLDGLADSDGSYVNDATVTLQSLTDSSGDAVPGLTTPLSMGYVASSNGKYQALIPHAVELIAGQVYVAMVRATSTEGWRAEWSETLLAKARTA